MNDVKRIIVVSLCAIVIGMFCFWVKDQADVEGWKTAYKYNIAIPVLEKDQFNYDVDSHQGLVITRGTFKTAHGAKFDEMNQTYTYVEKVHEHYTMHTSTYKCGKSTCTRVYYTWDITGREETFAEKTNYFGRDYSTSAFSFSNLVQKIGACSVTPKDESNSFFDQKHGCKESWGSEYYYKDDNDRYYYNAVPLVFTASFLTDTSDGTIKSAFPGRITLEAKSIEQMRKDSTGYKFWHNVFMVIGIIIIMIAAAFLGYQWVMADGKWSMYE